MINGGNILLKFNVNKVIIKIVEYVFILSLIVECRSIWVYMEGNINYGRIAMYIISLSCILLIIMNRVIDKKVLKKNISAAIIICGWLLLYWIQDSKKSSGFIILIITFFFVFIYLRCFDRPSLNCESSYLEIYENMIFIIAIISLFFWVFGSYLEIIKSTGTIYSLWGNASVKSYYGIYFETQSTYFLNIHFVRNSACFTEAPMASFHFSIAFLTELFLKKEKKIVKIIVFSLAILTTLSTTGYVLIILGFGLFYAVKKSDGKISNVIKVIIIPIIIVGGFVLTYNLIIMRLGTNSGNIRMDDIQAGIKAWSNNIIFGNGYGNSDSYKAYMSGFRSNNKGFSNSILQILAYGGVVLFAPYLAAILVSIVGCIKHKSWMKLMFDILFLFIFSITITPFSILVLAILTMISGNQYITYSWNKDVLSKEIYVNRE